MDHDEMTPHEAEFPQPHGEEQAGSPTRTDEAHREAGAPEEASPSAPAAPAAEEEPRATPEAGPAPAHEDASGPRIEIDVVEGDLLVRGGSQQVLLKAYGERTHDDIAEDRDGVLRFSRLPDDTEIRVPDGSLLLVRQVYGDLRVDHLDGFVGVQHIGADVELEHVAVVELLQIGGDLSAAHGGRLRARAIGGGARIEDYDEVPLIGRVGGDLEASDLPGLQIRDAVGGDVSLERSGEVVLIGTIGGDLRAERSNVTIRGSSVGGDVRLSSVHGITLAAVGGDFTVERVDEAVDIHSIGGDAEISEAEGPVRLGTVGGDLEAENISGGIRASRVGGDATLDTPLGSGAEYSVHASGDISLRVRGEVNARFVAQTAGGEIRTRLPLTVERGRRRNLVGILGRGEATVTLRSDGGDITLAATDSIEREYSMSDDFTGRTGSTSTDDQTGTNPNERGWEGTFGGQRFRVRWDRGPGKANFHFQGPFTTEEEANKDFHFEWEKGRGARMYGEYEQKLNELRDKAEQVAREAAKQAQNQAETAARRVRSTDWEAVGRDVRTAVERTMADLEEAFASLRREWETRRPNGGGSTGAGTSRPASGAQRVRIEYDDEQGAQSAAESAAGAAPSGDDADAQRRTILEQLRAGTLSLDEAERRLNELR
ncbi:MAG TPA: DUF4097 family beta strand repeat-containing protein [Ktedonobacterales bacterium]